jgi:hypothetical protein
MTQTRKGSFTEALTNCAIGFPINYVMNILILPITWDHNHIYRSGLITGAAFTVVSVIRQVWIRRWFNKIKAAWNTHQEITK